MTHSTHQPGVNLVGYFRAESGVGEIVRLLAATLEAGGVPYRQVLFDLTRSRQEHPFQEDPGDGRLFDINLICVNADQLPVFQERAGRALMAGRYNVGIWAWEVEVLPETMRPSGDLVNEVWGISRHTAACITPYVSCRVTPFSLPVSPLAAAPLLREQLELPESFLFLFCFDFDSVFERKNPLGVIEAFRTAFPTGGEPFLVIKSINGHLHEEQLAALHTAAAGDPRILVRDGYLSAEDQRALIGTCDAYVSLHRAEGFGLTMAEAMIAAKPVIATSYSSNLDFMDSETAYLVPYDLVYVPQGCGPYPTTARWAEPRLAEAAAALQKIWASPTTARVVGDRARRRILERHTPAARAADLAQRIHAISLECGTPEGGATSGPTASGAQIDIPAISRRIQAGPDVNVKSAFGPFGPWLRRAILRLIRPYALHQERVLQEILSAMARGVETEEQTLHHMTSEITGIKGTLADVSRRTRGIEVQVEQDLEGHKDAVAAAEAKIMSFVQQIHRVENSNTQLIDELKQRERDLLKHHQKIADKMREQQQCLFENFKNDINTQIHELEARVHELGPEIKVDVDRQLIVDREERHGHIQEISRLASEVRESLQAHEQRTAHLEEELRQLTETTSALEAELYAEPYLSNTHMFDTDAVRKWAFAIEPAKKTESTQIYRRFEDAFRGSEEMIRRRQQLYVPLLAAHAPVLDVGCGRGEMLDVLKAAGVEARGVDTDEAMISRCLEKGHQVAHADGIEHLRSLAKQSVGAVFSSHVIEHLTFEGILMFLSLSTSRIRAGGPLIIETVNPHAVSAFKTFWVDPTHKTMLYPEVLLLFAKLTGLRRGEIRFMFGSGDDEVDRRSCGEYSLFASHSSQPFRSI